jgi:hypothetical protein
MKLRGRGNKEAVEALKAKADATAQRLKTVFHALQAEGVTTIRGMAEALNKRGVLSPLGRSWHANTVVRVAKRLK